MRYLSFFFEFFFLFSFAFAFDFDVTSDGKSASCLAPNLNIFY